MTAARVPWDEATARACGIAWLLEETAPAGAFGRAARARATPFVPGDEARARAAIAACADFAIRAGADALASLHAEIARVPDLAPAIGRASAGAGATLGDADSYEALRFVAALRAIDAIARSRGVTLDPALSPGALTYPAALAAGATPGGGFYLADAFDAELARLRGAAEVARYRSDRERARIDAVVAAATSRLDARAGEFVVMRERLNGALPAVIRVLREAPTYVLCEVALDEPALAALTLLEDAERAVALAEDAVRERLSVALARDGEAVLAALAALGSLDLAVARAAFALRYATCVPDVVSEVTIDVEGARFLPIAAHAAESYVPLDFALVGASVLTGPNMGGKSTALRTAGFVAACVALGLPVPARRARIALFERFAWLAPREGDLLERGLSAFGAEIVRVRELLAEPPACELVLIDEFARTTTPHEGRALLVALLARLRERGALVFAATHASGVAAAAGATPLAVAGLREPLTFAASDTPLPLFEALGLIARRMDFRIVRVDPAAIAAGDAIALARALGLEAAVADRAEALVRESLA